MVVAEDFSLLDIKDEMEGSFVCPMCYEAATTPVALRVHLLMVHHIKIPEIKRFRDFDGLLHFLRSLIFSFSSSDLEETDKNKVAVAGCSLPSTSARVPPTKNIVVASETRSGMDERAIDEWRSPKHEPHEAPHMQECAVVGEEPLTLWHCPVCRTAVGTSCKSLETHCGLMLHNQWHHRSVEGMIDFYRDGEVGQDSDEEFDERDAIQEGKELGSDQEGGEWEEEEAIRCLYCEYEGVDCLEHMREVHQLDLKSSTSQRSDDIKDEYDLIRLVNMVRKAVAAGQCPSHVDTLNGRKENEETTGKEKVKDGSTFSTETRRELEEKRMRQEACAVDIQEGGLEAHLQAHPSHRLPSHIADHCRDEWLIPVLPGDTLLSHLMISGEGFLAVETPDTDFPVVPTILQLVEQRRLAEEKKRRRG